VRAWLMHIFLSQTVFRRVSGAVLRWRKFHTPEALHALALLNGLTPLTTQLLRYSLHGMRWKPTDNRHRSTRYLNFYTTQTSGLDAPRPKKAR
jgi:2-polyprenyl-3-methyl-5-hydroxy-6-metoxy-1,4-benzoquinol methylase